jgi:hypothetical protein
MGANPNRISCPFTDTKAAAAQLLLTQSAQVSGVAAGKAAEAAIARGPVKALDRKVTRRAMFGAGVSDQTLPPGPVAISGRVVPGLASSGGDPVCACNGHARW